MVRALLAGTKTQTRRTIKPRNKRMSLFNGDWSDSYVLNPGNESWRKNDIRIETGDRLWVKETVCAEELSHGLDGVRYLADNASIPIENSASCSIAGLKLHAIYGKKGGDGSVDLHAALGVTPDARCHRRPRRAPPGYQRSRCNC
jgi:hypothetical protein